MSTSIELATLADSINAAHDAAIEAARSAIEHARRCGELLIEAKRQIGHGGFLPWLTANCRVGERQARNYMRVAEHWETITAKSEPGSDLTLKGALNLIAKTQRDERAAEKSPPDLGSRIGELRRLAYAVYGDAEEAGLQDGVRKLVREIADELDGFAPQGREPVADRVAPADDSADGHRPRWLEAGSTVIGALHARTCCREHRVAAAQLIQRYIWLLDLIESGARSADEVRALLLSETPVSIEEGGQ